MSDKLHDFPFSVDPYHYFPSVTKKKANKQLQGVFENWVLRVIFGYKRDEVTEEWRKLHNEELNPYPTAFPYGNGMVLHFYQQQESSTTKTVHKVINKGLKTYV